jgi:hypothetical protein
MMKHLTGVVLSAVLLLVVVAFSFWGGVPRGDRVLLFWLGVILVALMLVVFGWATWHLLFRPLPAASANSGQPISAVYRQMIALLLSVSGVGFIVGGFWDEIWHRQYGIPFGEDFFWRPHLLMYFGIMMTPMLAAASLAALTRRGRGTWQQRFRKYPAIGLLILVGGLFLVVVPADPIWHLIYGDDITAWSLPHLLLLTSFGAILLLAAAIHMSTHPRRAWATPLRLGSADLLPLAMFAFTSLIWNQFFTTEWDGGARYVLARPEWLLPAMIVGGATLIGVMANHTLRLFGAATLAGLLALGLRVGMIRLFDASAIMHVNAWVLMLPSLVLIDLWYAVRPGARLRAGVAAAMGMGVALVTLYPRFYALYPLGNLPLVLVMVLLVSLAMAWIGAALGDQFAAGTIAEQGAARSRLPWASFVVAGATIAFVILFVVTAKPPV